MYEVMGFIENKDRLFSGTLIDSPSSLLGSLNDLEEPDKFEDG